MIARIAKVSLFFMLLIFLAVASAKDKTKGKKADDAKVLSGISIMGNKEAPKSLFIVPWKSSELGMESDLSSNLLNEKLQTIDKDVFERELDFYNQTAID